MSVRYITSFLIDGRRDGRTVGQTIRRIKRWRWRMILSTNGGQGWKSTLALECFQYSWKQIMFHLQFSGKQGHDFSAQTYLCWLLGQSDNSVLPQLSLRTKYWFPMTSSPRKLPNYHNAHAFPSVHSFFFYKHVRSNQYGSNGCCSICFLPADMGTSLHEHTFHITGPFCGNPLVTGGLPLQKSVMIVI